MAMNTPSISILGCGRLGLPLARHLIQLGFSVKGSTTTRGKLSLLAEERITPFLLTAAPQPKGEDIPSFFRSQILFLNIPFRRNLPDPGYYKQQIDSLIPYIESSPVEFVIFAGSTSVYPASAKEAMEDAPCDPDNPRAEVLREVEQSLLGRREFQTTVIRFAGLYGNGRHIGRALAGRKGLSDGRAPVNLIHLEDCVEIVTRIIRRDIRGEVFNACSDGHPAREEIYTRAAFHYGFEPPQFADRPQSRFKVVSNAKLKKMLNYTFKHPDPMRF